MTTLTSKQSNIRSLFDPNHNIDRAIEKVISYAAAQDTRLKAEIDEYVVTDSIEEQLEDLLTKMQIAMDRGGANEVGVWVSGFYGSGKSSFTKYLGLALDQGRMVDGVPFIKRLQDRLKKAQTKQLLSTVAQRFPAAVIFLDLASDMVAGATNEEVSTVLYYKVLQWAGYSKNLKIAALERKLKKDELYDKFCNQVKESTDAAWNEIQNDPLVIDSVVPELAHQLYPALFKTASSFSTTMEDYIRFETDRVEEMIAIAREHSGKEYVLFICDEVGQYVGARENLILNLDGLAKNLKAIGDGKVWIFGTAQQTLTEDDPRAALNSAQLFKLKDRFPIHVDLPSHDIREICIKRLLGKSTDGEKILGELFASHGQRLKQDTSLQDAKFYDAALDKENFVNLYPFLPAHFDILLQLLGELAKSTGGFGLRSAIKIIQDILVDHDNGKTPLADESVGLLVTTVTLYDALETDIERANLSIHSAVRKAQIRFPQSPLHLDVAKTIALLQILKNMPVTRHNVASLLHPSVDAESKRENIGKAIEELIRDPHVPLGEREGSLKFFSEKLNDIEKERSELPVRSIDSRKIFNEAVKEIFEPLPSTSLNGSLNIKAGIRLQSGAQQIGLSGEREDIQLIVEFVQAPDYDAARTRIIDESRQSTQQDRLFLLGESEPHIDEKLAEIYRCREIGFKHRNNPDQEIKEYCSAQQDRAERLVDELRRVLKNRLQKGTFVFRGNATAVETSGTDLRQAASAFLGTAVPLIYDKNAEAPVRVDTELPERFLRAASLSNITSKLDPLGLVKTVAGKQTIDTSHKAIISIRDYMERNGTVEGKKLTEIFGRARYGWSPDTLRYLVAAMLRAGEIRLKISGREITAPGDQAFAALKNNASFKPVGVALRDNRPSLDVCARAAERLTQLIGESVVPLEEDICKHALKQFPELSHRIAPLQGKLRELNLPGADRIESALNEIKDMLMADASDAPERLGGDESELYDNISWALEVLKELDHGLESTIRDLRRMSDKVEALPTSGIPGQYRKTVQEHLEQVQETLSSDDFFKNPVILNSALTAIDNEAAKAVGNLANVYYGTLRQAEQDLRSLPEWEILTAEERSNAMATLGTATVDVDGDLTGFGLLINQQFDLNTRVLEIRNDVVRIGKDRMLEKETEKKRQQEEANESSSGYVISVRVQPRIESVEDLAELIEELTSILQRMKQSPSTVKIEVQ